MVCDQQIYSKPAHSSHIKWRGKGSHRGETKTMEPRTKFSCRVCNTRVAVGVQCAACDFWYHSTPRCAGAEANLSVPPFICEGCLAQINVPIITHFAAPGNVPAKTQQSAISTPSGGTRSPRNKQRRLKLGLESVNPDDFMDSAPTAFLASKMDLRSVRRSSLLLSSRSLKAPKPVPHVSGAEVVFDGGSSTEFSRSSSSSSCAGEGGAARHADPGASSAAERQKGHSYHSAFAPLLKPVNRARVRYAATDVLHLIAPELRHEPDGVDPASVGGAASRLAQAFEDSRLDMASLLRKDGVKDDDGADAGKSVAETTLGLVEEFNSSAFGYQQGERVSAAQRHHKKLLQHKLHEKKVALKRRSAAAAAATSAGTAGPPNSTRQILLEHRKLYYTDVPEPLRAPWLDADGGDGGVDFGAALNGSAHLSLMKVPSGIQNPKVFSRLGSSLGVGRAPTGPVGGLSDGTPTKSLFFKTTVGLRISTVEEVTTMGYKDSSEEDEANEQEVASRGRPDDLSSNFREGRGFSPDSFKTIVSRSFAAPF
jgi:hypothetical protein